jgi:hypothetical protein
MNYQASPTAKSDLGLYPSLIPHLTFQVKDFGENHRKGNSDGFYERNN